MISSFRLLSHAINAESRGILHYLVLQHRELMCVERYKADFLCVLFLMENVTFSLLQVGTSPLHQPYLLLHLSLVSNALVVDPLEHFSLLLIKFLPNFFKALSNMVF